MEATLILASIVNRWNIEALTGPDVPLTIRTVLAPASYPVRLKHRGVTATEGAAGPERVI